MYFLLNFPILQSVHLFSLSIAWDWYTEEIHGKSPTSIKFTLTVLQLYRKWFMYQGGLLHCLTILLFGARNVQKKPTSHESSSMIKFTLTILQFDSGVIYILFGPVALFNYSIVWVEKVQFNTIIHQIYTNNITVLTDKWFWVSV